MNKKLIIYILIALIILILGILLVMKIYKCNCESMDGVKPIQEQEQKQTTVPMVEEVPIEALYASPGLIQRYDYLKVPDFVKQYDYQKAYDPLEQPVRRIPRHEIHPYYLKQLIDLPTRGYPDNFTQIGILVKEDDPSKNQDNKILRLFGRQEYPGSERYEYYTAINSGLDQIKIPIETRRRELYDDDMIYIRELKDHYRVHLHRYDQPKYYPDLI